MKTISCEEIARFKKLPGFVSLVTDQDSYVCAVEINGSRRRMGAHTLETLYESVKDLIERKRKEIN